jgi:uncharacterized protein YycO
MGVISDKMNLKPGDLGFTRITGFTGWWVARGQSLTGDANRFTHVFVVMDDDTIIEAMPGGARYRPLDREYKTDVMYARLPLSDTQRQLVVKTARELMARPGGIKYSFFDYVYLALRHFGLQANWLKRKIQKFGHMICSQLADYLLNGGGEYDKKGNWTPNPLGFKIFKDGRLPQDVTPGDLVYATDPRSNEEIRGAYILGTQKAGEPSMLPDAEPPL